MCWTLRSWNWPLFLRFYWNKQLSTSADERHWGKFDVDIPEENPFVPFNWEGSIFFSYLMHLLANSAPKEGQAELILKAVKGAVIMCERAELCPQYRHAEGGKAWIFCRRLVWLWENLVKWCVSALCWSLWGETWAIKYTLIDAEIAIPDSMIWFKNDISCFHEMFLFMMGNLVTSI